MIEATPAYDLKEGAGGIGRPRALLFDWDNTLVDNWDVITDAMNAVYDAFGMPRWTIDEAKAKIRSSMRDAFPKAFGDRAKEAGRIFSDYFALHHLERLREMPGAGGLLRGLAGSGLHLGVVSNKRGRFLRLEAERLGWTGHFGRLVGAADAALDKPAVEPVDLALAESGIARGRDVWFVGDTDIDMHCAVNAGCLPVLVRREAPGAGEFDAYPPALHLRDCAGLAARLHALGVLPSPNI
jgi:phosphoglycolate phosphatase